METNRLKRSCEKCSEMTSRITGKRKYFINRARAGESGDAAQKSGNEQEEESLCADLDLEPLSVDDYQTLLQSLKINLPEGALNNEVRQRSTYPEVIKDSQKIVQKMRNSKLTVAQKPRLSCVKVKNAAELRESGKITDFVEMVFFKKQTKASERTLKERWEMNAHESGCRFRIRDTFKETPISTPEKSASAAGARKAWFGDPADNKNNETDCFKFFLKHKGLELEDVNYKREYNVESGFISGRLDFLLDVKSSGESSETSQSEKIIIECKGTKGNMVGDVFTITHEQEHQAELNEHHEYYHQTQAYLYILKKEVNPVPVRAVIVVKVIAEDTEPEFYWGEVRDNSGHMEELNNFCQEEALPRFLAALNLIFQKVTEGEEEKESEQP
ncbi:hypothetical protein Q7C36_007152 [Tachysurus vachellii]|uniref:Uncharacterized protein n=1 Tax=Tachysurus vachellii TaxID=175792 RepID=A0AA88NBI9_TACVA|nr:hypothetical protein Q7C36_007152 [Tachysurus vachellii]